MSKKMFQNWSVGVAAAGLAFSVLAPGDFTDKLYASSLCIGGGFSLLGLFNVVGAALNYVEDRERAINDRLLPIQAKERLDNQKEHSLKGEKYPNKYRCLRFMGKTGIRLNNVGNFGPRPGY